MIKELNITNFRCYENTSIKFNGTSIIVGKNNAGKSTLIEALKIISSITRKYKSLRFVAPPEWVTIKGEYGVSPNVENMNISDRGIFHMYGNPPAIIEALFVNGTAIKAYVGEWLSVFAVIYDSDGFPARNSKEVKRIDIPVIEVLPQISSVLDNEKVITKSTVDNNRSTRLASRNFRNQLFYYDEYFYSFKDLVEKTWESLKVSPVESTYTSDGRFLQFFVRVQNFEAEIGWMGHGLQMWIQTMWFISQCSTNAIVVLDEPDVYMHADLQRRLIRLLSPMFPQLIIATHSLEIIEEVTSECIIPIDSSKKEIKPIGDETSLRVLTKQLGSPFNIDLARIFISNKFMIWDGDDISRKILSAFQSVLFPQDLYPLINLPKVFINGWNDWENIKVVSELFSLNKIDIQLFCIMNSDYHTTSEIEECKKEAKKNKINIHIWEKKEIENYAIHPEVIFRYISHNKRKGVITREIVGDIVKSIGNEMKDDIVKYSSDKYLGQSKDDLYLKYNKTYNIISGREFFNILSLWSQEEYGISISARQVIPYFKDDEVPEEIKNVIVDIMNNRKNVF